MTDKYYNTNCETGETLKKSRQTVASQEEALTVFFQQNAHLTFTRFELQEHFKWPTSSITRAMSNLKDDNVIVKLDKMRMGGMKKMQHCWALKARVDMMKKAASFKGPTGEKATKQKQLSLF